MSKRAQGFALLLLICVCAARVAAQDVSAAGGAAERTLLSGSGGLDLDNPSVQNRLRAAGIDPGELRALLQAQAQRSLGGAPLSAPDSLQYPPVTSPPAPSSRRAGQPDSARVDAASKQLTEPHFGYDLFALSPKTFEPLEFGPVAPDYLVGPGDEIIVTVWGAQELSAMVPVNREGYIVLPDLGQVLVNGLTLGQLKDNIEKRLARIYSGIRSDGSGRTFIDVSLGKLRSIQVFVLGDVVQPGGYTLTATSTAMAALYYAGGPTLKGSMRGVRVLRNNKVLSKVDLYDYVARGDRSQDSRLENGDVVFVPPVGRRVTLEGEVQHAAKYELQEGETLGRLLELAGGFKSTAYLRRVQIERTIPFAERKPLAQEDRRMIDINLEAGIEAAKGIAMVDGDIVRVFRVGEILRNTVRVSGTAVSRPGTYEHRAGLRVADVVEMAGGLKGDAYTGWAHVVRTRDDRTRELISFNLQDALALLPQANLELRERDELQVFSVWDIRDQPHVSVEGQVRKPGRYDLLEGTTLTDLIVRASGLRESAYRMSAEVARINPEAISTGRTAELIQVSMQEDAAGVSDASKFKLQKNDIVFVREIPNWSLQENVWVTGEVRFPGRYSLASKTERLSSVVDRAGGLDETAYLRGATFLRKKDNIGRMAIDFSEALKNRKKRNNKYDLVMAAGDSVHIPREPKTVKVAGEVGFPSSVLWEKGRGLDWYLEQAGGTLDTANKDKIRVVMANGRVGKSGWFSSPEPDAGAQVIVPRKPEQQDGSALKNLATIVSILSGAATTVYLVSQAAN